MRKYLFALLAIVFFVSCTSSEQNETDDTINIEGKVKYPTDNMQIDLIKSEGFRQTTIHSATLETDGTFKTKISVSDPGSYFLKCGREYAQVWIDNENIYLEFSGKDTTKTGSTSGSSLIWLNGGRNNDMLNDLNAFNLLIRNLEENWKRNTLNLVENDKGRYFKNQQKNIVDVIVEQKTMMANYLINKYGDCNSAVLLLAYLQEEELEATIDKLEILNPDNPYLPEFKENALAKDLARKKVQIGQPAPEFSYPDSAGKVISIQDFKGNILVVDFWASWCVPCLAEIPKLKSIYQQYNDKGVEILSVSLDKDYNRWQNKIKEEQLPWINICTDDEGIQVMKDYLFNTIPFVMLLDREGKIVAKQMYGTMLSEEIENLLNN